MYEESAIELKKYLNKLNLQINDNAIFSFTNSKIVDKKRIDDFLCCIEATFPKEFKNTGSVKKENALKSYNCFLRLKGAIQNKFLFFSSVYQVKHKDIVGLISTINTEFARDISKIYNQ